jgi:hypothetical protein
MVGALGGVDYQASQAMGLGKGRVDTKMSTNTKDMMNKLSTMASQLFSETDPTRKLLGEQFAEALSTGGVGAHIPIINRAVENSRVATSNTLRQLDDSLGKFNLAGTPYGQAIRANTLLGGELATGNIPTDFAKAFISMAPNWSIGAAAPIGQMAGSALQAGTNVDIAQGTNLSQQRMAEMQAFTQLASSFMGMAGSVAAGAMKA